MMQSFTTTWEDEDNNRILELAVQCRLNGDAVEIVDVIPHAVTFVCGQTGEHVRKVRVHTETGRQILRRALHAAGGIELVQQAAEEAQWAEAV